MASGGSLEEFTKNYYVHPETIAFLHARAEDNVKPYYELGVDGARKASMAAAAKYGQKIEFSGMEEELIVPTPYSKGN